MNEPGKARHASGTRLGWLVALLAASVLLNYVDRGAIGIAAPKMKEELGFSATEFGTGVSAFFWAYAPLCLVMGWLCDRFCVYRVFALGVALWALSTVLTGFVSGLAALVVFRVGLGIGEAVSFPGSSKIFAAQVPAERRGIANAAVAAAIAFGPAVGSLAGGTILAAAGWRPIFWTFGLATLLWLAPWQLVTRPLQDGTFGQPAAGRLDLGKLMAIPTLWIMGAAHFLSNYGFYFLLTWLPLWLTKTRGYSIEAMTALTTLGFVAQGIAALVVGHWSDRQVMRGTNEAWLRRQLMIFGHVATALAIAGIYGAQGAWSLGAWLVLAGLGTSQISTNLFAVGQIFSGPRAAGGWIGMQNALGNISGILGPIATGLIVDYLGGFGWAFALAAALAGLGAVWWAWAVPEIRQVVD
ncbi:MAG: MFS transporter [Sphingomonadaceae bacterium]